MHMNHVTFTVCKTVSNCCYSGAFRMLREFHVVFLQLVLYINQKGGERDPQVERKLTTSFPSCVNAAYKTQN
jgi:hypothetical protein